MANQYTPNKHILTLGLCAVLALTAACKDEAEKTAAVPAPAEVSKDVLPDGMPPQPQVASAPLSPPTETMPLASSPTLNYNDAPVDPLCFLQTWNQETATADINLAACETPDITRITDENLYTPPAGFQGAAYRPSEMDDDESAGIAFIEYKYLGDVDGNAAILLRESGGGSGLFTTLYLMKREGDTLKVIKPVAGGDRCNGGIVDAQASGGVLSYSENLTPLSLFVLGGGVTSQATNDIPDCASCCYATAHYSGETLDSVHIDGDLGTVLERMIAEAPGDNSTAVCVDGVMLSYIKGNKLQLGLEDLNDFSRQVQAACLPAAPAETAPAEAPPAEETPAPETPAEEQTP